MKRVSRSLGRITDEPSASARPPVAAGNGRVNGRRPLRSRRHTKSAFRTRQQRAAREMRRYRGRPLSQAFEYCVGDLSGLDQRSLPAPDMSAGRPADPSGRTGCGIDGSGDAASAPGAGSPRLDAKGATTTPAVELCVTLVRTAPKRLEFHEKGQGSLRHCSVRTHAAATSPAVRLAQREPSEHLRRLSRVRLDGARQVSLVDDRH